ncbi:MAG: RNA polymerase sigma factor [bacterium]|nr:RNA polymerase sigma factor [bacterium]
MAHPCTKDDFLQSYDEFADKIYRYCYYRVYDADAARDLVQEVFMRTWRYLSQGNTVDNMQAFLYRTAMNCIINESKKAKKNVSLDVLHDEGFDPGEDTTNQMMAKFDGSKIIAALDQLLDDSYRQVILLRYINDLEPREIAEITGETPNVISVRLHRALKKLKEVLTPYD